MQGLRRSSRERKPGTDVTEPAHDPEVKEICGFDAFADRHQRRREGGIPTVTTIVGPTAVARRCWRAWCGRSADSRKHACVRGTADWFGEWFAALLCDDVLVQAAFAYAGSRLRLSSEALRERLAGGTEHELDRQFRHAGLLGDAGGTDAMVARLLFAWHQVRPAAHGFRARTQAMASTISGSEWEDDGDRVRVLADLIPEARIPALLICVESHGNAETMAGTMGRAVKLVMAAPSLPLALAVPAEAWRDRWKLLPECFEKSAVSENVIWVAGSTPHVSGASRDHEPLPDRSEVPQEIPPVDDAAGHGCPTDKEAQTDGVGASPDSETTSDSTRPHVANRADAWDRSPGLRDESPFRSAAEALLHQLLEDHPATAGHFQPAEDPGFWFGNRPAEVDLLCSTLKIAIEVDGYYHFCEPDGYRRDRRKDVLLQKYGFLVLRFLARDVAERGEEVVNDVVAAVHHRRQ